MDKIKALKKCVKESRRIAIKNVLRAMNMKLSSEEKLQIMENVSNETIVMETAQIELAKLVDLADKQELLSVLNKKNINPSEFYKRVELVRIEGYSGINSFISLLIKNNNIVRDDIKFLNIKYWAESEKDRVAYLRGLDTAGLEEYKKIIPEDRMRQIEDIEKTVYESRIAPLIDKENINYSKLVNLEEDWSKDNTKKRGM